MSGFLLHVGLIPLLAVAWTFGFVHGWRRHARRTPRPICGCRHHVSFHDERGCHFVVNVEYAGERHGCGCRRYVGPGPSPEFLP